MNSNDRMRIAECGISVFITPHSTFQISKFLSSLQYFHYPGVSVNLYGIACFEDRSSNSCTSHGWDSILSAHNCGMAGQTPEVCDGGFDFGEDRSPGRIGRRANP